MLKNNHCTQTGEAAFHKLPAFPLWVKILPRVCAKGNSQTRGGAEQRWKMSNLLHGPISTNQILPQEKRVNRGIFGTSNLQNRTYGVSCDE